MSTLTRVAGRLALFLSVGSFVAVPYSVEARPQSGFSIFGGTARHVTKDKGGSLFNYTSEGVSAGFDYQFALGEYFSINLFVMSTEENFKGASFPEGSIDSGGHGIIGLQGRLWFGNYYLGAHAGSYNQRLSINGMERQTRGEFFNGYGLATGYRIGESGFYLGGQIDRANLLFAGFTEVQVTGARLHFGHRW